MKLTPTAASVPTSTAVPTQAPQPTAVRSIVASAPAARGQYGMDAQHSGRSPFGGPSEPVLWRSFDSAALQTAMPGAPGVEIQGSAAIGADGTIYFGNVPGNLMALRDPGFGSQLELLWRFHPDGASSFQSTPAIAPDGTIYIGFSAADRGTLYALDQRGEVKWAVDLGVGRQTTSPTLGADGTIYVTSGAGKLFAISPAGMTLWTARTGPVVKSSPALGFDGTVYVASMDGMLYAVAPGGAVPWTFGFDGEASAATPTVGCDGTIFIGANDSHMYAVTAEGELKWRFEAEREEGGIWSSGALSEDGATLYFGANKGGIYALGAADGQVVWQFDIYGSVSSSPTLDRDGVLYTGSTVGHVFAIDSQTGERVWDWPNVDTAPVWSAPAMTRDGTLVIGDAKGFVRVLGNA